MEKKTFIVRLMKKENWEGGYMNMDLSWDVPFDQFTKVIEYLSQFEGPRPKRKK